MLGDINLNLNRERELLGGADAWRELLADPAAEVSGTRWMDPVEEGCRREIELRLAADRDERRPFGVEGRIRRVNGEIRWVAFRFVPQQPDTWLVIVSDIDAGKQRDIFLATLSHEMRTPLTSILGWTQILRADGPGTDLFVEALDAIEQSATVQQRLIEDMLDISRIITGKLHFEFTPVEIPALIASTIDALVPRAREAGQHIRFTPSDNFVVHGDATRLRQALWNLLTNAMKFTPPGGLIEVATHPHADAVTISVRDTGRGIRPEVLPHVFDRFHQAAVADRAKHGGLGLGLAIVRNIIDRHGGTVAAESPGEGKGATFSMRLPLHTEAESPGHIPSLIRNESDIDAILADSFPASDPPPWTLGGRRRVVR